MLRGYRNRLPVGSIARAVFGASRRVWIMVFVAYFDASGHEDDPNSRVVTVAGFASTESQWSRFEDEWLAALRAEGVTMFHMKDFAHSRGEFLAWKNDERRRVRFLAGLLKIISRRTRKKFSATVLLEQYRDVDRRFLVREALGAPYCIASQFVVVFANAWMRENHPSDGALYVFEKGDDGQGQLQRVFRKYFSRVLEVDPIFVEKKPDLGIPLQAADFIAYEHAKAFNDFLKIGKKRARESAVPLMPRERDRSVRLIDSGMLLSMCRDLGIPRRVTPAV